VKHKCQSTVMGGAWVCVMSDGENEKDEIHPNEC